MAFPIDAARVSTDGSTAATNKVCNLPTGIVSGHLLVLLLRSAGVDTHSTPGGWTQLFLNDGSDASDDFQSCWYRVADGTEGGTVTVNGAASLKFAALSWRITGADPPLVSTAATGTSTTPNPPTFTPAGGAKDYLWLWLGGWEGEQTSPPAGNPFNYSNPAGADSGTAGIVETNCRVAGASRQLNAASEDPPSWTISVIDDWNCRTLAVPPGVSIWQYTGSGGATAGGSAGKAKTKAYTPTGGAVAGGGAGLAKVKVYAASGGGVSGGVAATAKVKAYGASGGAASGGVAGVSRTKSFTPTGGGVSGGAAVLAKTKAYEASGGGVSGGVADVAKVRDYPVSGGATAGGSAITQFVPGGVVGDGPRGGVSLGNPLII